MLQLQLMLRQMSFSHRLIWLLLLLLLSSFSTMRAGHRCRASLLNVISLLLTCIFILYYYAAVIPVHFQLLVFLTLSR